MMTLILKAEVIVDINVNIIYLPLTYKMSGPLYIYYILYILYIPETHRRAIPE